MKKEALKEETVVLTMVCFGKFNVLVNGSPLPPLRSMKGLQLLAYLVLKARRYVPRHQLAAILWPNAEDGGLSNLRRTLTDLRRALGPASERLLCDKNNALCLDVTPEEADVLAFDALENPEDIASLEIMSALHQGPLFDGWGNRDDETWIVLARVARQARYEDALQSLLRRAWEEGKLDQAMDMLRREFFFRMQSGMALLKSGEDAWLRLMQTYYDRRDYSAALDCYQEWAALLHHHWQAEPMTSMRNLYESTLAKAPSVRSLSPIRNRLPLPIPPNGFFGREIERKTLRKWLVKERRRLVTLTGPGGIGKTRLALETLQYLAAHFKGRCWFVPLVAAKEPHDIATAILKALGQPAEPDCLALEQIADYLNRKPAPALLALDNYEQLVLIGGAMLQELLHKIPLLTCLVTSRRMLASGSQLEIASLPFPHERETPENQLHNASIQMFAARARQVSSAFTLTSDNLADVATLCRLLEGIPLALEIVASRSGMMTPAKMVQTFEERLTLLKAERPAEDPRHCSLDAATKWSYDLLPHGLRTLFSRLSVFEGGWTCEAAQAVSPQEDMLDALERLRTFSLITVQSDAGAIRWRMLEVLREFGRDQLLPEERIDASNAHADFYARFLQKENPLPAGQTDEAWLNRIALEYPNIKAALAWELETANEPKILRCQALQSYWHIREAKSALCEWLRSFIMPPKDAATPFMRHKILVNLGGLSVSSGDYARAEVYLLEGLDYFDREGHLRDKLGCLTNIGYLMLHKPDQEQALVYCQQGLALARELKLPVEEANHHKGLAHAKMRLGDYSGSQTDFEAARALFIQEGETVRLQVLDFDQGGLLFSEGKYAEAITHWEAGLATAVQSRDSEYIGRHLGQIGNARFELGEWEVAKDHWQRALRLFQRIRYVMGMPSIVMAFARMAKKEGYDGLCGHCVGVAESLLEKAGQRQSLIAQETFAAVWDDPAFQKARQQARDSEITVEKLNVETLLSPPSQ